MWSLTLSQTLSHLLSEPLNHYQWSFLSHPRTFLVIYHTKDFQHVKPQPGGFESSDMRLSREIHIKRCVESLANPNRAPDAKN